jgi:hypothetical protein
MGVDLLYVRCAEGLIAPARADRGLAEALMCGGGGAAEVIDIGRSADKLYGLLGPAGGDVLIFSDSHDDWAGLALAGDDWLHPAIDTGYGSPRFLRPPEVGAIARELGGVTEAVFVARYENVIRDAALLHGYLLPNFLQLRRFYLDAAREHHAVIVTPT